MLRSVAVVVVHGFLPFEFGTICEVFGVDRTDDGLPRYDFAVVSGEPPPLRAHNDFTIQPSCGLQRLADADLIALPAVGDGRLARPAQETAGPPAPPSGPDRPPAVSPGPPVGPRRGRPARPPQQAPGPPAPPSGPDRPAAFPPDLLEALRAAVDRGARVLSICSGAFILGEAGLLDGRRCTTHWRHAAELARRFPQAKVDPDVLYVDDDPVITSAGTAAGIDACLD